MKIKVLSCIITASLLQCFSCSAEESPDLTFTPDVTVASFPIIDGSDSTDPLRTILMCKLLGFKYKWECRPFTQEPGADIKIIIPEYTCSEEEEHYLRTHCLKQSNTHGSFVNLIDGTVELVIAARSQSRDEVVYAQDKGIVLIEKPIAKDALAFMVNPANPVDNLSTSQLQGIYIGDITNWRDVGGNDEEIKPYVRNRNSGSQEKFETLVMDGLTIKDFPELQVGLTMMSPYYQLESDTQGIGYSPFYYYSVIVDNGSTKAIGIEGIDMTKENVRNGTYPYTTEVYAAVRSDIDPSSMAYKLFEFLTTSAGQKIIDESGYVPLQANSSLPVVYDSQDIVVSTMYTDLHGRQYENPQKGIQIRTKIYHSGRFVNDKVILN